MLRTCFLSIVVVMTGCSSSVAGNDGGDAGVEVSDVSHAEASPTDVTSIDVRDVSTTDSIDVAPRDTAIDRPVIDIPYDVGISCGSTTCGTGQVCCAAYAGMMLTLMCMDSCPDASVTISCSGPENCGGNPCCADFSAAGMSGSVMCTTSPDACVPSYNLSTRMGQTRLCHTDSDCAPSTQLPNCCTITNSGVSEHICFNSAFVSFFAGATCP